MKQLQTSQVERLASLTAKQSQSRDWYRFRAGTITASKFHAVVHTQIESPSVSLLKDVCYPGRSRQIYSKAIKKAARVILTYGENTDGYCNSSKFICQFRDVVQIASYKYPSTVKPAIAVT